MKYFFCILFLMSLSLPAYTQSAPTSTSKAISEKLSQSIDKRTIIIATHIEPPLVYIENEAFHGSNVEVARLLARRMNKTAEFIYCPFARCLAMTREGKADMMVSINKTEEREAYFSYLEKPFRSKLTPVKFYVASSSKLSINSYEDLKGLTIGVLRGATYFKRFDKDKTLDKFETTSHSQLIEMLLKGRIDTFLGREVSIRIRVDKDVYDNEMEIMPYLYTKKLDSYIAISKKSPLNAQVNEFSRELDALLESGEIENTLANYE